MEQIRIEYVDKLHPIFTKPKRIKILVGGRGSTKSTAVADYVAAKMSAGELWCCARENQNSIEESVHRTLLDEISRLGLRGFKETKSSIEHTSGGRCFYRGLARNITSLKSTLSGVDGLWIEEGEDTSTNSLRVLTASVRLNATDTEKLLDGKEVDSIEELEELLANSDVKMPEIIITMNRHSSTDAIAEKWLKRAEDSLSRTGFYEDDTIMVVQINYTDMPKSWFIASGLERERLDDYENLPRAQYNHKWLGEYLDEVDDTIISGEWFDAAIDAHLKMPEAFKPYGMKILAHDPSDGGKDAAAVAIRHGSIIQHIDIKTKGTIDEMCDWATGKAIEYACDWFVWDGDGMGTGLRRQVDKAFEGTRTRFQMFKGSLMGSAQDNATMIYERLDGDQATPRTYANTFKNNRAQYYYALAQRFKNTYDCIVRGKYVDPDDMISLSSEGIGDMVALRRQVCRIPRKSNGQGVIQIMSKDEMAKLGIKSPNEADAIMMTMVAPSAEIEMEEIDFVGWS